VEAHGHMDHGGCALFVSHHPQRPGLWEMARRLLESPTRLDSPAEAWNTRRARARTIIAHTPSEQSRFVAPK
jgi:hypothetical protein